MFLWGTAAHAACVGDCFEDDRVTVDDLLFGINIVRGQRQWYECPSLDQDGDEAVSQQELLPALEDALYGCLPAPPTVTPVVSATRLPTTTPLTNGALRPRATPPPIPVVGASARHGLTADARDATRSPFFLGLTTAGCNLLGLLVLYRRQRR